MKGKNKRRICLGEKNGGIQEEMKIWKTNVLNIMIGECKENKEIKGALEYKEKKKLIDKWKIKMRKKQVLNLERDKEWKTRIKIIKASK